MRRLNRRLILSDENPGGFSPPVSNSDSQVSGPLVTGLSSGFSRSSARVGREAKLRYLYELLSDSINRMGRRGFLKTLVGLGVSANAAEGLTKEKLFDLVDDPRREVPLVHSYVHTNHEEVVEAGAAPEREPVHFKLPRRQWARIEAARDARKRIEKELENPHTAAFVTTNSNGEKLIRVRLHDDGSLSPHAVTQVENNVPDAIDGIAGRGTDMEERVQDIPVTVTRVKIDEPEPRISSDPDFPDDFYYWDDWNEAPAGAAGLFIDSDNDAFAGTFGTPVYDELDESQKMTTAGHNITKADSVGVSATPPLLDEEFNIDKYESTGGTGKDVFDAALLDDGMPVQYQFATDWGTTGGDIVGVAGEYKLAAIEDDGTNQYDTFKQQGAREGKNSQFGIDDIGSNGFVSTLSESETNKGDSGGPYHIEVTVPYRRGEERLIFPDGFDPQYFDTYNLIAGIHQGDKSPYTAATSMYRVEQKWSVTV